MLTKFISRRIFVLCLSYTLFFSCTEDPLDLGYVPGPNSKAPVAKANNDTTLFYPENSVILDATKSYDPASEPLTYSWKQLSGPVLIDRLGWAQQYFARIDLFELGTYVFELKVTNFSNVSDVDTVTVLYESVSARKKIFLQEYGTHLPVEGMEAAICIDPTQSQCSGQLQQFFSDAEGSFNFNAKAYYIEMKNVESKGYWKSVPGFYSFYSDGNDFYSYSHGEYSRGNGNFGNTLYVFADTLKAYLIPVVEIPVRVKDKRTSPTTSQYFAHGIMIDGYNNHNYSSLKEFITLRPGIDTTFTIKGYGNMKNGFTVAGLWFYDWGGIYPESIVFESEKTITRNTRDTVYIKY